MWQLISNCHVLLNARFSTCRYLGVHKSPDTVGAICRQVTSEKAAGRHSPTSPTQTRLPFHPALTCTVPPWASRPTQQAGDVKEPQAEEITGSSTALLASTVAASPAHHQPSLKPHIDAASSAMLGHAEQQLVPVEAVTCQRQGVVEVSAEQSMQHQQSYQQDHAVAAIGVCNQQQRVDKEQHWHKVGAQPLQSDTACEETHHRGLFAGRGVHSEDQNSCHMHGTNEQCEDVLQPVRFCPFHLAKRQQNTAL